MNGDKVISSLHAEINGSKREMRGGGGMCTMFQGFDFLTADKL